MAKIKKISSEIIHKNPWWEYKCDKIVRPNGSSGEYCYIETPGNCVIIPILDDGRLVLVRQYRYLNDKYSVEFPGGGIRTDEAAADGAKRELLEESGYNTDNVIKISSFEPCVGVIKDACHVFIANELTRIAEPVVDEFEHTEIILRRVDEFEEMIKRGEIWAGQTLAAWTMARNLILKNI
jgi:ADP-ribose pyrophosphatase